MLNSSFSPALCWECGTAYDFFVSLHVLHYPDEFGLRGQWAAGVRSRIPPAERKMLEEADAVLNLALGWIHELREPKDAATVLTSLEQLPAVDRLPALALRTAGTAALAHILCNVAARRAWDASDLEALRTAFQARRSPRPRPLDTILDWWSRPVEFGEGFLAALQAYFQVFFAEEELRIRPQLQAANERAYALAARLELPALLEELSQGVRFTTWQQLTELILAPSYWSSPLVVYERIAGQKMVLLYGARPADTSLVPGDQVPDALLQALKALADPTRLRILRYLQSQPLTPSQLARRLRLRAPTVIHHLNALRLAGLVYLTLNVESERNYATRAEIIPQTFALLQDFLQRSAG